MGFSYINRQFSWCSRKIILLTAHPLFWESVEKNRVRQLLDFIDKYSSGPIYLTNITNNLPGQGI